MDNNNFSISVISSNWAGIFSENKNLFKKIDY